MMLVMPIDENYIRISNIDTMCYKDMCSRDRNAEQFVKGRHKRILGS